MQIGQLADATGVSTKTLRFYELEQLLPAPARTTAGYRDYPDEAVGRVTFIKRAQAAGLTLRQIGQILTIRDGGEPPCRHVARLVDQRLEEIDSRLVELQRIRNELRGLHERLARLDPADCGDDDICVAVQASAVTDPGGPSSRPAGEVPARRDPVNTTTSAARTPGLRGGPGALGR